MIIRIQSERYSPPHSNPPDQLKKKNKTKKIRLNFKVPPSFRKIGVYLLDTWIRIKMTITGPAIWFR